MSVHVIQLRRMDTSQPWGFKMQGGSDVGHPPFAAHVSPNSVAGHAGLKPGDAIIKIGSTEVAGFTHEQTRGEMIRSGNEIDLTVQRGAVSSPQTPVDVEEPARMSVSEHDADTPFQDVQPKTYKVLESELNQPQAAGGARPASIFDKKRQNRSAYTKTDKSGYIKPFGAQ